MSLRVRCRECQLLVSKAAQAACSGGCGRELCHRNCLRYGPDGKQCISCFHSRFAYTPVTPGWVPDNLSPIDHTMTPPTSAPSQHRADADAPRWLSLLERGQPVPAVSLVGGKGAGLLGLAAAAPPAELVPGFVLTTAAVQAGEVEQAVEAAWQAVFAAAPVCVAVRSSATVEDSMASSCAGMFETVLNVDGSDREAVLAAVARVLASVDRTPAGETAQMAVIVMEQVDAEVSGVAFSMDPRTNRMDRFVVTAARGEGRRVVDGAVVPDTVELERATGRVCTEQLGPESEEASGSCCLSAARLQAVHAMIAAVEQAWMVDGIERVFVDLEFSFRAGASLPVLLQTRPITSYHPLPVALLCLDGSRPPALYQDQLLSEQGISTPLSVTGSSVMAFSGHATAEMLFGHAISQDVSDAIYGRTHPEVSAGYMSEDAGRSWMNVGVIVKLSGEKKAIEGVAATDGQAAEIMGAVDLHHYRATSPLLRPKTVFSLVRHAIGHGAIMNVVRWYLQFRRDPAQLYNSFFAHWTQCIRALEAARIAQRSLPDAERRFTPYVIQLNSLLGANLGVPLMLLLARTDAGTCRGFFEHRSVLRALEATEGEHERVLALIETALASPPRNLTVEFGALRVEDVADALTAAGRSGEDAATVATRNDPGAAVDFVRSASEDCARAWDALVSGQGLRSYVEVDSATPRFTDRPQDLLSQIASVLDTPAALRPRALGQLGHQRAHDAVDELAALLERVRGSGTAEKFRWHHYRYTLLAGQRETPKLGFVFVTAFAHEELVLCGRRLAANGTLDDAAQVFDLTAEDVDAALATDAAFDVHAIRDNRLRFRRVHRSRLRSPPNLIASNGEILTSGSVATAGAEEEEGVLRGQGVSRGVVTARVRVIESADELARVPFTAGDVLVARAAHPGYVPALASSAGVVLESGGVLQHIVLLAREMQKPAVIIPGSFSRLHTGDEIELDGTHGVVRLQVPPNRGSPHVRLAAP